VPLQSLLLGPLYDLPGAYLIGAMPDRKPEPWESSAASPFLWIETARGNVEVWALGEDRFRITAPGHEQIVTGFEEAERAADALAEQLE